MASIKGDLHFDHPQEFITHLLEKQVCSRKQVFSSILPFRTMTIGGLAKSVYRRSSIITTKTVVGRCMSKVARWNGCYEDEHDGQLFKNMVQVERQDRKYEEERKESCWIPDSRTGIYYPKGHELVMKDVPDGAASFTYTYWHRNSDINGV